MQIIVSIEAELSDLPPNIESGALLITMTSRTNFITWTERIHGAEARFNHMAAGDYDITAQRLDSRGEPLGAPLLAIVTVESEFDTPPEAPRTYYAPMKLSVIQIPD